MKVVVVAPAATYFVPDVLVKSVDDVAVAASVSYPIVTPEADGLSSEIVTVAEPADSDTAVPGPDTDALDGSGVPSSSAMVTVAVAVSST